MDWFLYDIGLNHERVKLLYLNYTNRLYLKKVFLIVQLIIAIFHAWPYKTGLVLRKIYLNKGFLWLVIWHILRNAEQWTPGTPIKTYTFLNMKSQVHIKLC